MDFNDFNNVYPKDSFLLPCIDLIADSIARHAKLYGHILGIQLDLHERDGQSEYGTHHRLGVLLFPSHAFWLEKCRSNSKVPIQHLKDMRGSFLVLCQYQMNLNPTRCAFSFKSKKFLGS